MIIDTHAHIYADQFKDDLPETIDRARAAGVGKILLPNIDVASIPDLKSLSANYPDVCFPMMGLHPCSVQPESWQSDLDLIYKELKGGDYIAVGEIGIDLYWDKSTLDIQKEAFAKQIQWSIDLSLPFCIHARESFQEIFEVMDQFDGSVIKGVFHCFTGGEEEMRKISGDYPHFMFGLGGVSTFKNSGMDRVIPHLPEDKIILETDSPYLAPTPHRGKRNEPAYTALVAQRVADLRELSLDRLSNLTTENAARLFQLEL